MPLKLIQIDRADANEYYVICITQDGQREHDSVFHDRKVAERRAGQLSRTHGCEWEANY